MVLLLLCGSLYEMPTEGNSRGDVGSPDGCYLSTFKQESEWYCHNEMNNNNDNNIQ